MAGFLIFILRWAVAVSLLYIPYRMIMRHRAPHSLNRMLLAVTLILGFLLPFGSIFKTTAGNAISRSRSVLEQQFAHSQNPEDRYSPELLWYADGSDIVKMPISLFEDHVYLIINILIALYLTGVVYFGTTYFFQFVHLEQMIRESRKIRTKHLCEDVNIIVNENVSVPFSWMNWVILPPEDAKESAIVVHELAHARLHHSWDTLFCDITCLMLWWLPFIWMLRQDLQDVHEYQADQCVLRSGVTLDEYTEILIDRATVTRANTVVSALNQSPIKRRLIMLFSKPFSRWSFCKAVYLLPIILLSVTIFAQPKLFGPLTYRDLVSSGHQYTYSDITEPLPAEPRVKNMVNNFILRNPNTFVTLVFYDLHDMKRTKSFLLYLKSSQWARSVIAERSDMNTVFVISGIQGEVEEFRHSMEEWMCDEEVLAISREDFVHFQKALHFSDSPHYVTVSPDGLLVREAFGVNCFTYGPRVAKEQIDFLVNCRSDK